MCVIYQGNICRGELWRQGKSAEVVWWFSKSFTFGSCNQIPLLYIGIAVDYPTGKDEQQNVEEHIKLLFILQVVKCVKNC